MKNEKAFINGKSVKFIQDSERPYRLNIVAEVVYTEYYSMEREIGFYNFAEKWGCLHITTKGEYIERGDSREYSSFKPMLNLFFKLSDNDLWWSSDTVEAAKQAGKEEIKRVNDEWNNKQKEENKNDIPAEQIEETSTLTENEEQNVLNMGQKWFDIIVTYNGNEIKHGLWAKNIEDAREKAYFKWINADNREVVCEEIKPEQNDNKLVTEQPENNQEKTTYIVGNRSFPSYSEAEKYCNDCDFDHDMIIVEGGNIPPSTTQNNTVTAVTEEPETFHYYKQTFDTYMDAYNYVIRNLSPVSMVISSKHPTMTNERLQQLEEEYIFNKRLMAYDDMKEYYSYLLTISETLDQIERVDRLKSWIQRYENKQERIKQHEAELKRKSIALNDMLMDMYDKGMAKKEHSPITKYFYKGENIYTWFSGITTETMHDEVTEVYNRYFLNGNNKAV